jgi:hypothetical protein
MLITGPAQWGQFYHDYYAVADLYELPAETASNTAQGLDGVILLAERCLVPPDDPASLVVQTDIRGRLLVERDLGASGDPRLQVFRIDLATGTQTFLGLTPYFSFPAFTVSPGRTRVLDGYGYGNSDVWELDDGTTSLDGMAENATFVGEDVYYDNGLPPRYQTPHLWRLAAGGQPELLEHNVRLKQTVPTDRGPRLFLEREIATQDAMPNYRHLLFDPLTQQELALPVAGVLPVNWFFAPASPDGHWLALAEDKVTLFNWVTSETQEFDDSADSFSGWEWRPGRNELWLSMSDATLRIWKPGAGVTTPPAAPPLQNYRAPDGSHSVFTRDGNYWFSGIRPGDGPSAQPALYVGSADDPSAPTFQITPAGALTISHWELADGRIMAGAWTTNEYRKDYYLVDPRTGSLQTLAINGLMVTVGQTRALAYVDWQTGLGTGDLCLIDLATGTQTLLANNVYAADVDPGTHADVPMGTDTLAPGTRIAFLVRDRLASPYDGLWVTELP